MKLDYYSTSSLKKKILSGGFWAIFLKIATGALALVVNILLIRIMTMEDVGSYFITHSMVTIFSLIAQFGLPQLIVRLVSENIAQNNLKKLKDNIYTIVIIALFSCFLVGITLIFFAGEWVAINLFKDPKIVGVINLVAFWMVALSFQQIIVETFRGLHDIKMASLFSGAISNFLMVLVLCILFYLGKGDFYLVIKLFTLAAIISVIISAYILKRRLVILKKEKYNYNSDNIVKDAWPLWITSISVFILTYSDLWIVTYFLSKTDVALYGSSAKLLIILSLVVSLSYAVLPPIISEMNKRGEFKKLQNVLRSFAFGNSLVVSPIFLIIIIFPGYILELFFGESYIAASSVLIILSIGKIFNVITGMRGYVLILTGYGSLQMKISLFVGLLNIIFCCIGALYWGIVGVSLGAMSAMIIQCLLEMYAVKYKLGVWTHFSLLEFKNLLNKFKNDS